MRPLSLALALLACLATTTNAQIFEKYITEEKPEGHDVYYYVPPPDGPVLGGQNGWFNSPKDLALGSFGLSGILQEFRPDGFTFLHKHCVWGNFTYKFTRTDGVTVGAEPKKAENMKRKAFANRMAYEELAHEIDGPVLLSAELVEIVEPAKVFRVKLKFGADQVVPGRMEVVDAEYTQKDPDVRNLRYGPHWKQSINVYLPEEKSDKPWPAVVAIHGGGWGAKDKASMGSGDWYREHGVAYVTVGYRYVSMSDEYPAMEPPVAAPLLDAARAIQMLRYKAEELNIDPNRLGFTGGSAGGATSTWLACHDDLADPDSEDPVARMSTKPQCAVPVQAQTSLDPKQMQEWIPGITYGTHAFFPSSAGKPERKASRVEQFEFWMSKREEIMPWIEEFSAYEWISEDDPPILFNYIGRKLIPVSEGANATHHAEFGRQFCKRMKEVGAECWFVYGEQDRSEEYGTWRGVQEFFMDQFFGKGNWER